MREDGEPLLRGCREAPLDAYLRGGVQYTDSGVRAPVDKDRLICSLFEWPSAPRRLSRVPANSNVVDALCTDAVAASTRPERLNSWLGVIGRD